MKNFGSSLVRFWCFCIVLILLAGSYCLADVRLAGLISDNMVLQQQSNVSIWGWAEPGEKVSVKSSWLKVSANTIAEKDGKWAVKIKTPKAGGPYSLTIKGENEIILENVLIGEVWLCSGQSNMAWTVEKSQNAETEIAAADHPEIRFFTVEQKVANRPLDDCAGSWKVCEPNTVAKFSAVAYYFGRELQEKLNVPVGLINSSWGGTPAQAWTSNGALQAQRQLQPILQKYRQLQKKLIAEYPDFEQNFEAYTSKWIKDTLEHYQRIRAFRSGQIKERPEPLKTPAMHKQPSVLYNGMIAPVMAYKIKGAIWYQGEANVDKAYQYRTLFPTMIRNWRADWGQGDFPFYYVQIAPFNSPKDKSGKAAAELRQAQFMTLSLANTGMAVTMGIGDVNDIHPKNKLDVGRRLSLWALAKNYKQKNLVYSGPLYRTMKIKGNKIQLNFDHIGSGLMAKDGPLTHFEIAGSDQKFVHGQAVIDGNRIIVSSDTVKNPVAVRYGWANDAVPNLFNKEGLPASSFRTDDWPGVTLGKD